MILRLHRDEKSRLVFSMENDTAKPLLTTDEFYWVMTRVKECLQPDVVSMNKGYLGSVKRPQKPRKRKRK
jgi:hypothetical protein